HAGARPARRNDYIRSVHQRRLADQPSQLRAAEILQDIALPDRGAIGLEARQIAVLAEHVQAIPVDRRRAARTRSLVVRLRRAQRFRPELLSVRAIEGNDDAVSA